RSPKLGPRRELPGSRSGQPLRRRRELLPIERRGEPRAHRDGERPPRGGSPAGAAPVTPARATEPARMTRGRSTVLGVVLLLAIGLVLPSGNPPRAQTADLVRAVAAVGMTVADMDRSVAFYGQVLGFRKVSDAEASGPELERLQGVFGLRVRVV